MAAGTILVVERRRQYAGVHCTVVARSMTRRKPDAIRSRKGVSSPLAGVAAAFASAAAGAPVSRDQAGMDMAAMKDRLEARLAMSRSTGETAALKPPLDTTVEV